MTVQGHRMWRLAVVCECGTLLHPDRFDSTGISIALAHHRTRCEAPEGSALRRLLRTKEDE